MKRTCTRETRRGSALLAVLWLSIALSAIAFALSRSVRTELERAALNVDSTRAYFLAQGAIERAMMHMTIRRAPDALDLSKGFQAGQGFMRFDFPGGSTVVEITGESGKLNLNRTSPELLARLLAACGLDPVEAVATATRIVEARAYPPWSRPRLQLTANLGGPSSFSSQQASFQELEELLMIPGVTPEILFGTYRRHGKGEIARVGGLYRHVTLRGGGMVDLNYASVEVLAAAGVSPPLIQTIAAIRAQRPLDRNDPGISELSTRSGEDTRLGVGGASPAYTLRATARERRGGAIRTVAALVQVDRGRSRQPLRVVRWHDLDYL